MSKKSDSYYFQNFIECVECGCQAAKMLEDNLNHFDTGLLQDKLDELHRIEAGQGVNEELLDTIQMITTIMKGMQEDIAYDR